MATITSLSFRIVSTYTGRGADQARRDIAALRAEMGALDREQRQLEGGLRTNQWQAWGLAIAAVGPALVPVAQGLLAVGAATAVWASAAAGAAGIWGLALKGAITQLTAGNAGLLTMGKHLAEQKAILGTMTPGTKAYADQLKKVNQLQSEYNAALAKADPAQRNFVKSFTNLQTAWNKFIADTRGDTLGVAAKFMDALAVAVGKLVPVVKAVTPLAMQVAQAFRNWVDTKLDGWVGYLKSVGVPALQQMITIGRNVGATLGAAFKAFAPLALQVGDALVKASNGMKNWAVNGGFQRFMDTVTKNGPAVREFFNNLGAALANIGRAFGILGPAALNVTNIFLRMIATLPPQVLAAIIESFVLMRAAMVGMLIVTQVEKGIKLLQLALIGARFAALAFDMSLAPFLLTAGLVVAVVAALGVVIYLMITRWKEFATYMSSSFMTAWNAVKNAFVSFGNYLVNGFLNGWNVTMNSLKTGWAAVSSFFVSSWNTVSTGLTTAWNAVWNGMKTAALAVWNAMKIGWSGFITGLQTIWTTVSTAVTTGWNATWNGMKSAAQTVWDWMRSTWNTTVNGVKTAWDTVGNALKTAWSAVWNGMKTAADAVWNWMKTTFQATLNFLKTTHDTVTNALKAAWQAVWNAMKTAAETVWNWMKSTWQTTLNSIKSTWDTVSNALKSAWQTVWNFLKSTAQAIWDWMKSTWTSTTNTLKSVWDTAGNALKSAWSGVWNAIKSTAETVWNSIKSGFSNFAKGVEDTLSGLVNKAKDIWSKIVDVFKTPVNAVIGIWDTVAGAVGLPKINKLATGGYVTGPGGPTDDRIPALLSNGEYVLNADAVNYYGLGNVHKMNRREHPRNAFAEGGLVGYASGGLISGIPIPDPIKHAASAVGGAISGAASAVAGVAGDILDKLKSVAATAVLDVAKPVLDKIVSAIPHPVPGIASPAGDVPYAGAKKIEDAILDKLKAAQEAAKSAAAAVGGTIPTGQHKALIDQALAKAGIPQSQWPMWEAGLNTLITRESSWNPSAINLWDSNAKAGHPTQGLMQLLPSNFAKYGLGGSITNPVDNIVAGIRYINAVYGGIGHVQQANANASPKGYFNGTMGAASGWHIVGERGPELVRFRGGEKVWSNRELVGMGGHGGHGGVHVEMPIHVHGNLDSEAVAKLDNEVVPRLRILLAKRTGCN